MKKQDIINGRCGWCKDNETYIKYHDEEWGRLVKEDKKLFEFLLLESAQAGLSWITILNKREGYRKAFWNFDVDKIALMTTDDIAKLQNDDAIIKNKLKITSAKTNAILFKTIQEEYGSFYKYIISFFPNQVPITNHFQKLDEVPTSSSISDSISKDMKKRGFKFFGTTICYAFLQATGFINDHLVGCICRSKK